MEILKQQKAINQENSKVFILGSTASGKTTLINDFINKNKDKTSYVFKNNQYNYQIEGSSPKINFYFDETNQYDFGDLFDNNQKYLSSIFIASEDYRNIPLEMAKQIDLFCLFKLRVIHENTLLDIYSRFNFNLSYDLFKSLYNQLSTYQCLIITKNNHYFYRV